MRIANRTTDVLTYRTQKTGFIGPGDEWITWEWISPGQTHDEGQGEHDVHVSVAKGKVSTADGPAFSRNLLIGDSGPYLNTHEILLVNGGRTIVDWSAVRGKYLSDIKPVTSDPGKPNPELEQGLQVASAVISACATGLAALGPAGAAPATIVQALAAMMGLAASQSEAPTPPNIDQIEAVIERVVKQQSDKDFALAATDSFLLAQQWLLDQDAALRDAVKAEQQGKRKPELRTVEDDFFHHLEGWADENREFYVQLHRMRRNPEIAKWIIPALLAGVGAYLQIWRLHAVANHKVDRATIQQFQREVDTCSQALAAAASAWWGYVLKRLQDDKIYRTPEGDWAYHTLNRAYVGASPVGPLAPEVGVPDPTAHDTTPVGSAVFRLKQIHDYLEEDLKAIAAGKPPIHFYKPAWEGAWKQIGVPTS